MRNCICLYRFRRSGHCNSDICNHSLTGYGTACIGRDRPPRHEGREHRVRHLPQRREVRHLSQQEVGGLPGLGLGGPAAVPQGRPEGLEPRDLVADGPEDREALPVGPGEGRPGRGRAVVEEEEAPRLGLEDVPQLERGGGASAAQSPGDGGVVPPGGAGARPPPPPPYLGAGRRRASLEVEPGRRDVGGLPPLPVDGGVDVPELVEQAGRRGGQAGRGPAVVGHYIFLGCAVWVFLMGLPVKDLLLGGVASF
mmetsp:Transcript_26102/g.61994  ORF Transcript_26102/g.61994 Transcript_26102/m.61994 type:complete len:253 (-) Transcript_26102:319-1077(-)